MKLITMLVSSIASLNYEYCRKFIRGSLPLILPRWRVQDIDTPEDWRRQFMHQTLHE